MVDRAVNNNLYLGTDDPMSFNYLGQKFLNNFQTIEDITDHAYTSMERATQPNGQ
jgi:hypothetical protein